MDTPAIFQSNLNMLPRNNGIKPLWRPTNDTQQYFEVDILVDRNNESDVPLEKNIDEILNLNKYMCHICNIDVPKTYLKEHRDSVKHKTCNEIANIALERTKLQMQLDITIPRKVEILDTYFCEPCASVVLNTDKETHETTKLHKVSIKHDELLSELLKIYSNIDNVEVQSEIDELELLKQQIEIEKLEETKSQNKGSAGNLALDLKAKQEEVHTDLNTGIKTALDAGVLSEGNEVSEVNKFDDIVRIETATVRDKVNALGDKVKEYESTQTMPDKNSSNSKNRPHRKYMGPNKKKQFHKRFPEEINTEGNNTETNDLVIDMAKSSQTENEAKISKNNPTNVEPNSFNVAKETKSSKNKNSSLNDISKKIYEVMAKYFDNTRTVDALNNNTGREHKNKRTSRETKKSKHISGEKDKKQNQKGEVTKQDKEQNKDKEPNEDKEINRDSEDNNNMSTERNKNKHNENTTQHNKKNKKTIEQQKTKDTPKKISKLEKSHTPNFNLVFYLKDIARKCETQPIHTMEAITDTIIQITAINGDTIRVFTNNFHSFHMKDNDIYCKVCESPNVRRPEWHIAESEHRAKVMLPIKDRNGIRQLDDIWSHCILCDDLTKNVDFHLRSLLHKNKLKHCLVELGPTETFTDDNNSNRDNIHKCKKDTGRDGATINTLILKNNLAMTNKNYLNCAVCDVIVNYDLKSLQQHINSFDHLNNFEREKNDNKLIDIDDEISYCMGCDANIPKYDIVSHSKGKKHKRLLQDLLKKQGEETELNSDETEIVLTSISQNVKTQSKAKIDDFEMICFVCNVILYCVDEHMGSFDHKKSYYAYLEANKLNEIEADTFYCIPCNTVITIDYIMSHCTSRKHRTTVKNYVGGSVKSDTQNTSNDENMLSPLPLTSQVSHIVTQSTLDKAMPLKILYQFREMSDSTKLLCTVCDEEVTYSRKLAKHHVSTLDHVVAFNLMMLWNKIKRRHDRYFCDICRLDMTYFSEITHVFGRQHANNLAKEPKGTIYEYDRTLLTHAYAMSHKVGDRIRPSPVISATKKK